MKGDLRWPEKLLHQDVHAAEHLGQQEVFAGTVEHGILLLVPPWRPGEAEPLGRRAGRRGVCAPGEDPGDGGSRYWLSPQ